MWGHGLANDSTEVPHSCTILAKRSEVACPSGVRLLSGTVNSNDDLGALIARHVPGFGVHKTALERVTLVQSSTPTLPMPTLYAPAVCFVASGRKQVDLGAASYVYDAQNFLIVSVDLPVVGSVIEATVEAPFLCMRLDIDARQLGELMLDEERAPELLAAPAGLMLGHTTTELTDAAVRLLRLLEAPADARVLAPLAEREILYRLLTGSCSEMMRHIASADSRLSQIGKAISWLRANFRDAFNVEDLATRAGMSPSAFHRHFKAITTMTTLEFRNALRLQEARRMMVADGVDAAAAGFDVGFHSPSQFSLDYVRLFGASPLRDARRLRERPEVWQASQI